MHAPETPTSTRSRKIPDVETPTQKISNDNDFYLLINFMNHENCFA